MKQEQINYYKTPLRQHQRGTYSQKCGQQTAVQTDHFLPRNLLVVHVGGQGHSELHGDVQHQLIHVPPQQAGPLLVLQQLVNLQKPKQQDLDSSSICRNQNNKTQTAHQSVETKTIKLRQLVNLQKPKHKDLDSSSICRNQNITAGSLLNKAGSIYITFMSTYMYSNYQHFQN